MKPLAERLASLERAAEGWSQLAWALQPVSDLAGDLCVYVANRVEGRAASIRLQLSLGASGLIALVATLAPMFGTKLWQIVDDPEPK